eukprot:GHVR01136777.1.p1 GENE.GHVR01136777.1~~GHVR01136777.1.p1  ORF type:complete len:727 (+),score=132.90 GHVR01136777.1:37-2217(+)
MKWKREDYPEDLWEYFDEISDTENVPDPIVLDETFPRILIVTNLPKVDAVKSEKLSKLLQTKIEQFPANINIPKDENNMSIGVAFISLDEKIEGRRETEKDLKDNIRKAKQILDGFGLDKKHTLRALTHNDYLNLKKDSELTIKNLSFSREDFRWWLLDPSCREQFVIRYQEETEIYWHDAIASTPQLCYNGERERTDNKIWCRDNVQWSDQGSYLVTFHYQGVGLWAGPQFEKKIRMEHCEARSVSFSPNEDFMLTWDGKKDDKKDNVMLWRVQTGEHLRSFATPPLQNPDKSLPYVLWSSCSKFVAVAGENEIKVYETELLSDLKYTGTRIKYEQLETFSWSPSAPLLAVWQPERENSPNDYRDDKRNTQTRGQPQVEKTNNQLPAKLSLYDVVSGKDVAKKTLFNAREATMHWQNKGNYLAANVTTVFKSGKRQAITLLIFRVCMMSKGSVPVEAYPLPQKEHSILHFSWDNGSNRFCVMMKHDINHQAKLHFYSVGPAAVETIDVLDVSSTMTNVFWAPTGQYFVIASIGHDGALMFCSLNPDNKIEIFYKWDLFMLREVSWDFSGRFVCTSVLVSMQNETNSDRYAQESKFYIWSFQGKMHHYSKKERLYLFKWRPHPTRLLSDEKMQQVKNDLKSYSKKFDRIDEEKRRKVQKVVTEKKEALENKFFTVIKEINEWKNNHPEHSTWCKLWKDWEATVEWDVQTHITEEVLEKHKEPIEKA